MFLLSLFVGELAITESVETQTAILAFTLRIFAIFTTSLFVITSMLREFNDKGFELVLSHPLPRSAYYFGKLCGYATIAFAISCASLLLLLFYDANWAALVWSLSLFFELLITISLSLLCLFTLNSITLSFSMVAAFYILSRSMEAIQLISDSPIVVTNTLSYRVIDFFIDAVAYLLPDLYRFTKTEWLVYGMESFNVLILIFIQTIIYVLMLAFAALFDLYRKEL